MIMNLQHFFFHPSTTPSIHAMANLLRRMSSSWVSNVSHARHHILSFGSSGLLDAVLVSTLKMVVSIWSFSFSARFWQSLPFVTQQVRRLRQIFGPAPYDTYKSRDEEEKYWKEAGKSQKILQQSDARYAGAEARKQQGHSTTYVPPLVMYYTPALLPEYRDAPRKMKAVKRYYISGNNYRRWHWMVFPGDDHPTIAEANKLRNLHSAPELRMIDHIARMLSDDEVLAGTTHSVHRARPWKPKYQNIWLAWFNSSDRRAERAERS